MGDDVPVYEDAPHLIQVGWTWDSHDGTGVWHVWPMADGDYPGAEPCYRVVHTSAPSQLHGHGGRRVEGDGDLADDVEPVVDGEGARGD